LGGGGTKFLPEKYVLKSAKCPNFTWFLPEKLSKYPNFYDICPKKITIFPNFTWFLPEKYVLKSGKCPNFTWFLPEKLSKYPNFYDICPKKIQFSRILHDFCPNNARILHNNNCPKNIFFQNFRGARAPLPPYPTPMCATVVAAGCYNSCMHLCSTSRCMLVFISNRQTAPLLVIW